MAALDTDYAPMSDMRASAAYRSLTAKNMLRKVYLESQNPDAEVRVVPESAHG
jgi:xanthine dehydrogenase small subunit